MFPRLSRAHVDSRASSQHRPFSPQPDNWSHTSSPSLLLYPDTASEGPLRVTLQWQGEAISTLHVCREGPGLLWNGRHFQSEDSLQPHLPHQHAQECDSQGKHELWSPAS